MEQEQGAPQSAEPSIDQVTESFFGDEGDQFSQQNDYQKQEQPARQETPPEAPPEKPPEQNDKRRELDKWSQLTEKERQIWRESKRIKEESERIKKEREELDRLRSNPKELLGAKNNQDVERLIQGLFEEEEDKPEHDNKSPEELRAEIEESVMKKIEEREAKKKEETETESELREFKNNIKQYVETNAEQYPLTSGMQEHDLISEVIQQKFIQDSEAYGQERAQQMMLSVNDAGQRVEKYLESQIGTVLQSPKVRSFVQKLLNSGQSPEQGQDRGNELSQKQESSYQPETLNNNDFSNRTPSYRRDDSQMTDEQAFEEALKLV